MARWAGRIGFSIQKETSPGVWEDCIIERKYVGDTLSHNIKNINDNSMNGAINISNQISVLADPYALSHFAYIKFITFMGEKWLISNIEVNHPRLIFSIGGLYNEETN